MPNPLGLRSLFGRSRTPSRNRQAKIKDPPLNKASRILGEDDETLQSNPNKSEKILSAADAGKPSIDASTTPNDTVVPPQTTPLETLDTASVTQTPIDLWDEAYKKLQEEKPKLFKSYKQYLLSADDTSSAAPTSTVDLDALGSDKRERYLATQIDKRLQTIKEKQWPAAAQAYERAVKLVLFAKDFIAQAASNEPHAALAWAG